MKHLSHYLCLYFPYLALEIFSTQLQEQRPFVLQGRIKNRRCVLQCNPLAQSQGLKSGMSISQAYSLCPDLLVKNEDPQQQAQALQQLAIWAYDISPDIFLFKPNALVLEVGSCLKMHGDLQHFLLFLEEQSKSLSYHCTACITLSFSGAYLLAKHYFLNSHSVPFQCQPFPLNALYKAPLSLMDISPTQYEKLSGMGFKTLGDLFALPESALHKRFGKYFIQQLREIKGEAVPTLPKFSLPEQFSRTVNFTEELEQVEQLLFPLKRVLKELYHYLLIRQKTLRQLKITLGFRELKDEYLYLGLNQNRQASNHFVKDMTALLRLKFSHYQLKAPVIFLSLDVEHFFPLQQQNNDLFTPQKSNRESPEALLDQLQARLGPQALQGISTQDDHRPERAYSLHAIHDQHTASTLLPERPLWLLLSPRPLISIDRQPHINGPIELIRGPERITSGWWDHAAIERDYFIARHHSGTLYWIFHDLKKKHWYLHGIFS